MFESGVVNITDKLKTPEVMGKDNMEQQDG